VYEWSDPHFIIGNSVFCFDLSAQMSTGRRDSFPVPFDEIYPLGTIHKATPKQNLATAQELSSEEQAEIRSYTRQYLDTFDYKSFI
jgi:hypothetical protein